MSLLSTEIVGCLGGVVLAAAVASGSPEDFARYEAILVRQPFGAAEQALEPETADVALPLQPPAFVKALRMCAITESGLGIRVGIVDIGQKPPKAYYLYVGDAEDGLQLVAADFSSERALLRKGDEQYWISMRDEQALPAEPVVPAAGRRRFGAVPAPSGVQLSTAPGAATSGESYVADRQRRLHEMRRRIHAQREMAPDDIENRLQEYQMQLIRSGKTPLPIRLSPAADAKLVAEGVLSPVESEEGEPNE
jgi:hypothetical protein